MSGAGVPTLVVAAVHQGPGDLDARRWLLVGIVLVAAGFAGYAAVRRRAQPLSAFV